ncbi:MAG: SDR family oxidoreductase [Thermodesulfobacteriota bacterium]
MNTLFDLHGKVALITGSSHGLGFAIARGLRQAGAILVLNGRNEKRLQNAISVLSDEGLNVSGHAFDVTNEQQIQEKIPVIEQEIGPIQILVNSAGVQKRGPLETIEESVWREIIEIDLTGVFLTSKHVAQMMIARKSGKIINICSLMSEFGRPTTGPYAAAKGGVKMLTKAMAVEWAKYNIQVNGIGPGYFLTEMTQPLAQDPQFDAWIRSRTPAGRWGDPAELVGTAIYLASSASDFVNGQIIYVDGGILAAI